MSDRIKKIKIKQSDGTFSDYIPIGADAKNIDTTRGESVQSVIDKTARYYNSIAEMKLDDNVQVGDTCVTLGYYEVNDGGSGTYKIVDDSSLEDDGGSIHELNNGLKAKLIIKNNQINVKQFGAKGDGTTDDTNAVQSASNASANLNIPILFIPNGIFLIQKLDILNKQQRLLGATNLTITSSSRKTVLKALNDTSEYLVRVKNETGMTSGNSVENICFDGNNYKINLLEIYGQNFFTIKNCGFNKTCGKGVYLRYIMESYISNCVFRMCGSENNGAIWFGNFISQEGNNNESWNCNNVHIDHCTFGYNSGNWIGTEENPNLDAIWIDHNKFEYDSTYSNGANTSETAVIRIKQIARANISDNTFFGFKNESNYNYYGNIILLDGGIGPVQINNNIFWNCTPNHPMIKTNSPTVVGKNNIVNTRSSTHSKGYNYFYADGSLPCYMEPIINTQSNGQKNSGNKTYTVPNGYIDGTHLDSSETFDMIRDEDSISFDKKVIYAKYSNLETQNSGWSIFSISKNFYQGLQGKIKIFARIKNFDDGIDKNTKRFRMWYFQPSVSSSLTTTYHPTDEWQWYAWELDFDNWTSNQVNIEFAYGSLLCDGAIILYEPTVE